MRKKSIVAAVLAVIILMLTFSSCSINQKVTQFKETDGGMMLYRYGGASTETEYTIPDEYEGSPVVEVADFGLANSEYLTKITIGKNVSKVNDWSFTNCAKLKEFVVDPENEYFTTIDGILYTKDLTELVSYPNAKTELVRDDKDKACGGGVIVLPEECKVIRTNAAYLSMNLWEVKWNNGLEKIGDRAFLKCWHLSNADLPNTVKEIGTDAFSYTDTLQKLEIPSSVEKIGNYAFYSTDSGITEVIIHNEEGAVELGKNWQPLVKGKRTKAPVQYVGVDE